MSLLGALLDLPLSRLELVLDTAIIQAAIFAYLFFARRHSAAAEHRILAAGVVVVLAVTVLSPLVSARPLGLIPVAAPAARLEAPSPVPVGAPGAVSAAVAPGPVSVPSPSSGDAAAPPARGLLHALAVLWLAGSLAYLAWMAVGLLYSWSLSRRARPTDNTAIRDRFRWALGRLGLRTDVALAESERLLIPVVFGLWRPLVILPARARGWSEARLGAVLLHESAHIRRRDLAFQFLARLTCALYWFNPLSWLVERRMLLAGERAADDHVIGQQISPADYAEHLMATSEELGTARGPAWATAAMAEGTSFKERILSILDPNARRGEPSRLGQGALVLAACALAASLVAFSPWAASATPGTGTPLPATLAQGPVPSDSLAGQGVPEDVVTLLRMLRMRDRSMREHAASALGRQRDTVAVLPLISVARNDPDAAVREHASSALGLLGDRRAAGPLADAMQTDPDERVRAHATSALGMLADRGFYDVLLATMQGREAESVRAHAAHALGMLGDARALAPLLSALASGGASMRMHAVMGLGALGDRRAIDALERARSDPDPQVRSSVDDALTRIRGR